MHLLVYAVISFTLVAIAAHFYRVHLRSALVVQRQRFIISQSDEEENNQSRLTPPDYSPIARDFLQHQTRVIVVCSVGVFFLASFLHEWIQASYQLYGEIIELERQGPPDGCQHSSSNEETKTVQVTRPHLYIDSLFHWLQIATTSSYARSLSRLECKQYVDSIHRLPIANPLTSAVQLVTHLFVYSWSHVSGAAGFAISHFLDQQSFQCRLLVVGAIVVFSIAIAQSCLSHCHVIATRSIFLIFFGHTQRESTVLGGPGQEGNRSIGVCAVSKQQLARDRRRLLVTEWSDPRDDDDDDDSVRIIGDDD